MAKRLEIYAKLACRTSGDVDGLSWPNSTKTAFSDRLQSIVDGLPPEFSITQWHVGRRENGGDGEWLVLPKVVVWLSVPDDTTHEDIEQVFVADGFWDWAKQVIRDQLPDGVTAVHWRGKLGTNLGRTDIDEVE